VNFILQQKEINLCKNIGEKKKPFYVTFLLLEYQIQNMFRIPMIIGIDCKRISIFCVIFLNQINEDAVLESFIQNFLAMAGT
jgi:hypothetical protein